MMLKAAFERCSKRTAVVCIVIVGIFFLSVSADDGLIIYAHENDTLMMSCCALDEGSSPLHQYEWTRLDADMPIKAVGENSSALFIPAMAVEDFGVYACRSSLGGSSQSFSVQVFLTGEPYGPPVITSTAANPPIGEGDDLNLKCTATGYPQPTYEWVRLDAPMPHNAVGVQSSMLTVPNVVLGDIGKYVCVASNAAGVADSKPIAPLLIGDNGYSLLYYGQPLIMTTSGSLTFEEGTTLMLHCCAQRSSLHTPDYAWIQTDGNMPTKAVGTRSSVLLIPNISADDVGAYACFAITGNDISLSNSADTVLIPYEAPIIQSTSEDITVDGGANITLSCTASGLPTPTYQWVKLGGDLPSTATGADSSLLRINNASVGTAGMYACIASNLIGTTQSDPIEVDVVVIPPLYIPPSINSTSEAVIIVEEGSDLTLTCSATGSPSPNYEWLRLDKVMPPKANGVSSPTLTIPTVDWSDVGAYACLAFNEGGAAQSQTIRTVMQGRQGSRISSMEEEKNGSSRGYIIGAAVGVCAILALTFTIATGIICFRGGLFGMSSSYSIMNVSIWDVMMGKNKGMTLLDHMISVENKPPGLYRSSSGYSVSVLNDPKITWEIRRPYSDSDHSLTDLESSDTLV